MATTPDPVATIEALVARVRTAVPGILADAGKVIPPMLAVAVEGEMDHGTPPPPGVRSTSDRLYIRTRQLVDSFRQGSSAFTTQTSITNGRFIGRFGSSLLYAAVHEAGNARTPARPFLAPAVVKLQKNATQAMQEALVKGILAAWQ